MIFHDAYKITIRAQVSVTWLVTQLWMGNIHVGYIRISNPNSMADTSSRNPREKKYLVERERERGDETGRSIYLTNQIINK